MTWKPPIIVQPSLDAGFARKDWSRPSAPPRRTPRAQTPRNPHPAIRQSQSAAQWARMWELKRRVADRLRAGESYEAALHAVKRELWPDQYKGLD